MMKATSRWWPQPIRYGVLVHGGAGTLAESIRAEHAAGCQAAAQAALELLAGGGSSLDAVQRATEILEADARFNAGVGASLTSAGTVELDASLMDGSRLAAGAVCSLRRFLHPIAIARAALEDGQHVFYAGDGAERFAIERGFEPIEPSVLITEQARERLAQAQQAGRPHCWAGGTVGAVAIDASGHLAAATSTGGTLGKRPGRVGDSPVIGAGTYAEDGAGAASATGDGEAILRSVLTARVVLDIAGSDAPEHAGTSHLERMWQRTSGCGGIIWVSADGSMGWARTTETMSWAAGRSDGDVESGT